MQVTPIGAANHGNKSLPCLTWIANWTKWVQLGHMQITRATDYAVRVMIHLAGLPHGSTVQQAALSKVTEVSPHFLSKVLQQLTRSGLIRSQRGSGGGFALGVPAAGVSLLDVVEAMEGPLWLNLCLKEGESCKRKTWCRAHPVWMEAQTALARVLRSASIASLAEQVKCGAAAYNLHTVPVSITSLAPSKHGSQAESR